MKQRNRQKRYLPKVQKLIAIAAEPTWGEIQAADGDAPALRTFNILAYTGVPIVQAFAMYPIVLDLAGMRATSKPRPILRDHDQSRIVGHTTAVDITAKDVKVAGVVSGSGSDAREVVENSKNGFPWQASVGCRISRVVFVKEGKQSTVNGRTVSGPVYIARRSELGEVSFVALGADDQTSAQVAASAANSTQEVFSMNFEKWLEAKGFTLADLDETQRATLEAAYQAETEEPEPAKVPEPKKLEAAAVLDPVAEMRVKAAAESVRIADVTAALTAHPVIQAKALAEGWTKDKAELEAMRADRPAAPAIIRGQADQDVTATVLEASIRLGSDEPESIVEAEYKPEVLELAYPRRRMGLRALIEAQCRAEGRAVPSLSANVDEWVRAGFSTQGLGGILGNTANKILGAAFRAVPSAARKVARKLSAADFKTHTGYRVRAGSVLQVVGPGGELKHGALDESSFTYSVDSYGEIIGVSRKAWINDDLGAFTSIPRIIGRKAARTVESVFWALVLANTGSFFHSDNINAITAAPVDATGYDAATAALEGMVDADSNPVLLTPRFAVVPPALAGAARRMFKSSNLIGTGGAATRKVEAGANVYEGEYEPVLAPYLKAATGVWYLFADASDVAAFGLAFLNGVEAPTVEDAPLPSDYLGKAWRGFIDFGCCQIDTQGAVRCTTT